MLADRVPSDKVDAVRTEQRLNPTVMVGDGINDAPALAAADARSTSCTSEKGPKAPAVPAKRRSTSRLPPQPANLP